jgi:hypothetical protein
MSQGRWDAAEKYDGASETWSKTLIIFKTFIERDIEKSAPIGRRMAHIYVSEIIGFTRSGKLERVKPIRLN